MVAVCWCFWSTSGFHCKIEKLHKNANCTYLVVSEYTDTHVSKTSVYKLNYQSKDSFNKKYQFILSKVQEHEPQIIKKVVLHSQTCVVSEFEAVLAAVYIAVKLKQEVSSDIDKNK